MSHVFEERVTFQQRAVLVLFLFDIMCVYPALNRLQAESALNRIVLLLLIAGVFFAYRRRLMRFILEPWDVASGLLMAYFLCIVLSTLGSVASGIQSIGSILTYGLNSFAPLLMYGCFVRFPEREFLVGWLIGLTALNVLMGALTFGALGFNVPVLTPLLKTLVFDPESHRLVSLVGKSTVIGYLALVSFAWLLFFYRGSGRYAMLFFFGVAVVLSFQRSMWGGLLLVVLMYLALARISPLKKVAELVAAAGLCVLAVVAVSRFVDLSVLSELTVQRLAEFDFEVAMQGRAEQQLLFATDSFGEVLVGEGYGKYSPLNKDENVINLPDAPYHMIFNETGIVGAALFVAMLLAYALRAFWRGNVFQLWLVLHLAIVLLGSRILWYFPCNFVVFMLLAVFKDDKHDAPALTATLVPVRA